MILRYEAIRQYTQSTDKISFLLKSGDKPYALIFFPENTDFVTSSPKMYLKSKDMFRVVVPRTIYPPSTLTPELRMAYKKLGYTPYLSTIKYPKNSSIIMDMSQYFQVIDTKFKPDNYYKKAGMILTNTVSEVISSIDPVFKKILLYTVDTTKPYNDFYFRKFFLELRALREENIPFDDLLFCLINPKGCRYRLLVKNREYEISKIIPWLKNFNATTIKDVPVDDETVATATDQVVNSITDKNLVSSDNVDKYKTAVSSYLNKNGKEASKIVDKDIELKEPYKNTNGKIDKRRQEDRVSARQKHQAHLYKTAIASVLYRSSGNMKKAVNTANSISVNKLDAAVKAVDKNYADELLPVEKPQNLAIDNVINKMPLGDMNDNKYPGHLFKKRNLDFEVNLNKDMTNAFKVLENKDLPIKLESIMVDEIKSKPGELYPSDTSMLKVVMTDKFGNVHNIKIEIPKIGKDGTFRVYGRRKCLINQIILCPISFPKQYMAKFESSYAIFHIYSRKLKTGNHLEIYIGSYRIPLLILMAYSFGWDHTLNLFGIKTRHDTKIKKGDYAIRVEDAYIVFENIDSDLKEEMCRSIIKANIQKYKVEEPFGSKKYFNDLIIKMQGRVGATYTIDTTLDNIVDPIAKQVLINQQLPIDLDKIIYYMAEKVSSGYIQDRNDLSNQRIRNSEVLVHLAQKQILAAYTTYREQVLSGNESAKFDIVQNKVLSDFIKSEIVVDMEYSNPLEELGVLMRVSPVGAGIGGIPSADAITLQARNVNKSYYGNIDPLDTPEGPNVGIVQHLAVDASLTSSRGLIQLHEFDENEKAGTLSVSSSMVPFIECNEGARMMFSCNQSRQALPLKNPESPFVQTGYESLLTNVLSDYFIKRSPCNGKVLDITKDSIVIQCTSDKSKNDVDISPRYLRSGSGKNTLSIFNPVVTIGQPVKKNQTIAEGSSIKNGIISQGRNLLTAIMPYRGFNYEDGIVINERLIEEDKFTSLHLVNEEVLVDENDRITFIFDKIGEYTNKGDHLVRKTIGEIEKLIGYEESDSEEFIGGQAITKSPGGMIVDIEVFSNLETGKFPQLDQLRERTNRKRGKAAAEKFTIRGKKISGVLIRFNIQQELKIAIADKMCNRYGNKGIVSLIEKNENMPRTPWGETIDIIHNPLGVLNRMNIGQLYELYTGLIGKELAYRITKNPKDRNGVANLLRLSVGELDTSPDKKFSEAFINGVIKLSESEYNAFIKQIYDNKVFPMVIPPFKSPTHRSINRALANMNLKTGYQLYMPEYKTNTASKVPVGYMYMYKLEHLGDLKFAARSTGRTTGKYLQPTQGKKLEGGQKVGELDSYSLISYGCLYTLQEFFGPLSDDHKTKNELISDIMINGQAEFKKPKSNPTKDILASYLIGLMLDYE